MAEGYIGLSPSYGFFNKQNIAGTTATTYNLDYDVANANQLIVSLDGIIQEPGYAFSVGRSSAGVMQITFAEALTVTTAAGNTTLGSGQARNNISAVGNIFYQKIDAGGLSTRPRPGIRRPR